MPAVGEVKACDSLVCARSVVVTKTAKATKNNAVVRLAGLGISCTFYLSTDVDLAGTHFTINVQSGRTKIVVNGKPQKIPLHLPRGQPSYHVQFVK